MIDEQHIKQDWQARNFSFGIWDDPPGQVWKDFIHDADELFMVVEGDIELFMAGNTLHPAVGDEIVIPAHTLHTVKNIGQTISRWYYGYHNSL